MKSVLIPIALLALTACGSSSSSDATSAPDESTAASTEAPADVTTEAPATSTTNPAAANNAHIPEVGENYLREYADLPWVSVQTRNSSRQNRNSNNYYNINSNRPNGRSDVYNNNNSSMSWRKDEVRQQQSRRRRPNSYGEFQLQELQPKLREVCDNFKPVFRFLGPIGTQNIF